MITPLMLQVSPAFASINCWIVKHFWFINKHLWKMKTEITFFGQACSSMQRVTSTCCSFCWAFFHDLAIMKIEWQRRIEIPINHLRWNVLWKKITTFSSKFVWSIELVASLCCIPRKFFELYCFYNSAFCPCDYLCCACWWTK